MQFLNLLNERHIINLPYNTSSTWLRMSSGKYMENLRRMRLRILWISVLGPEGAQMDQHNLKFIAPCLPSKTSLKLKELRVNFNNM